MKEEKEALGEALEEEKGRHGALVGRSWDRWPWGQRGSCGCGHMQRPRQALSEKAFL